MNEDTIECLRCSQEFNVSQMLSHDCPAIPTEPKQAVPVEVPPSEEAAIEEQQSLLERDMEKAFTSRSCDWFRGWEAHEAVSRPQPPSTSDQTNEEIIERVERAKANKDKLPKVPSDSAWSCSHCNRLNNGGQFKCSYCPNTSGDEKWQKSRPQPPSKSAVEALSGRVRPGVEAAPWVCREIMKLETELRHEKRQVEAKTELLNSAEKENERLKALVGKP